MKKSFRFLMTAGFLSALWTTVAMARVPDEICYNLNLKFTPFVEDAERFEKNIPLCIDASEWRTANDGHTRLNDQDFTIIKSERYSFPAANSGSLPPSVSVVEGGNNTGAGWQVTVRSVWDFRLAQLLSQEASRWRGERISNFVLDSFPSGVLTFVKPGTRYLETPTGVFYTKRGFDEVQPLTEIGGLAYDRDDNEYGLVISFEFQGLVFAD